MRIFDFGLNCLMISVHILKAGVVFNENDPFSDMAVDLTLKELAGLPELNTSTVGIAEWSMKGDYASASMKETKNPNPMKYSRVLNFKEYCNHPFTYNFDYDIFIEHDDEPLTLMQEHGDGSMGEFDIYTSRLGLLSRGLHNYYGFRKE